MHCDVRRMLPPTPNMFDLSLQKSWCWNEIANNSTMQLYGYDMELHESKNCSDVKPIRKSPSKSKCHDIIEMRISCAPNPHAWWKDQPATSHEHSPLSLSCQIGRWRGSIVMPPCFLRGWNLFGTMTWKHTGSKHSILGSEQVEF